jgi:outer membrane immunogenic protein
MRRFTLALAAVATIALGATAASAADLGQRPVYKAQPQMVVAAYNWSGFYIGGHLGYGWSKTDVHDHLTGLSGSADPSGFLGGGQIGFNWQTGAFVFGIEGDGSWTNADGSRTFSNGAVVTMEHNWYATLTGRVGYAVDNWLWYVKGGGAWSDADYSVVGPIVGTGSSGKTRSGWTVGTGLEWALAPNWSAKIEYNYLDFGREDIGAARFDVDTQVHLVKLGLNYRFDWGKAPVVARY